VVSGQQQAPAALNPRKRPGTHFTGGWVGPRAGLDGQKISSPPGFDPQAVQPVVSRYTDWATRPTFVQNVQYNLLNMHSGNVVIYRYMNSRRKILGMSCDSVRILHAINTATRLQGSLTESDFSGEKIFMCSYSAYILPTFLCLLCKWRISFSYFALLWVSFFLL